MGGVAKAKMHFPNFTKNESYLEFWIFRSAASAVVRDTFQSLKAEKDIFR